MKIYRLIYGVRKSCHVMFVQVLSSVWQYVSVYVHSSRYTQTAGLRGEEEEGKVCKKRIRW